MSKALVRAFVFSVLITSIAGCMTILIEGSGDRDKTTDAQKVEETIHGSFWGFNWVDPTVSKCEKNKELYRIKYHQNALFVLTSVATLGLYVPQSVEWWCVAREDSNAEEEPSLKPKKKTTN